MASLNAIWYTLSCAMESAGAYVQCGGGMLPELRKRYRYDQKARQDGDTMTTDHSPHKRLNLDTHLSPPRGISATCPTPSRR